MSSEWISTAERLPEVEPCGEPDCAWCGDGRCCNSVLVLHEPGRINGGSRYQTCATAYLNGPHYSGGISHWMPLPKPPDPFIVFPSGKGGIPLLTTPARAAMTEQEAGGMEQALGLYAMQADAIRELLNKHAPHTTCNLQARVAQVLAGESICGRCALRPDF